ncbi:hypothetical protein ABEB36_006447 [Hypothenemus hampei]|uniref:PH domain-containing protein n=1 Tax=Hypothenemus hampei TaxID=57062 RepID=A0ABD1EQJ8_HYPHA
MDGFTQNILARARERQRIFQGNDGKKSLESVSEPNLSQASKSPLKETSSENSIPLISKEQQSEGSPGQQTNTLNIQRDDFNMEIKVNSAENVRVQVEIEEHTESGVCLREESKNCLKRLGKLYAGGEEADISSPIHRTEAKFYQNMEVEQDQETKMKGPKKVLGKLASLAESINQWEDDLSHPSRPIKNTIVSTPKKSWKPPAPQPPKQEVQTTHKIVKGKAPSPPKQMEEEPKKIKWDKNVLDTLESQGFTRSDSSSRLIYSYKKNSDGTSEKVSKSPSKVPFRSGAITNRAVVFEQKPSSITSLNKQSEKDPALLSLAARKALFEKNKGEALLPKAPFGMPIPVKVESVIKAPQSKLIGTVNKENAAQKVKNDTEIGQKITTQAVVHQSEGIARKMAALLENRSTISEKQITEKITEERQMELDMLNNRFKNRMKSKEIEQLDTDSESDNDAEQTNERTAMLPNQQQQKPAIVGAQRKSAEKRKSGNRLSTESDSPHVVSVLDEVKRIKVTQPKPGRLYPNLSDIEATTTDQDTRTPTPNEENSFEASASDSYDSDPNETSFGRDILQAVCKNANDRTPTKRVTYKDTSSDSSVADELDEILEEMEEDLDNQLDSTPSSEMKQLEQSYSFHYKNFNGSSASTSRYQSPRKSNISPRQSDAANMSVVVVDENQVMPLTHTVSFYRKQQNEVHTPVRQIIRQPPLMEEESSESSVEQEEVAKKIALVQEEVNRQQNIIAQTSQALNLCSSTLEFSGSTEQVEAEKVLLVATHRRQAALHELQRLKVEGTVRPKSGTHSQNVPLEKGTLTISNILLPLKNKYVTALAAAGGKGHHIVCLIKCGEQVVPTKLVSTVATNAMNPDVDLCIPGTVTLKNVNSDFAVTFEVYCLQAEEEFLPHDVKYHINKKPFKGLLTPKKSKQESRLHRPPKESPGGPQVVRTSSFSLMGYVVFSVQNYNKRVWTLNNTPSMSPLEGSVEMKITCDLAISVEHRAFLTMFEDISGFGAWHRRWCLLKGDTLSYWKYPEDEKNMVPIDSIDLKSCITKSVGPVSREICARLHTFLLESERPARPQDKNTLVVVKNGDKTIIRHLMSADTKEERIEWCAKLNATLIALKKSGNNN